MFCTFQAIKKTFLDRLNSWRFKCDMHMSIYNYLQLIVSELFKTETEL